MPSGGLLDLVAHGIQDVFLIGNPQITFFKTVYKRHTNFSMESIQIPLTGDPNFNTRYSCTIPVKGDLLSSLFLEVDLPQITSNYTYDPNYGTPSDYVSGQGVISWINNIGHGLIDHIDFKIGGQIVDTNYGEWMEIWTELTQEIGKKLGLDYMLSRSAFPGLDGPQPIVVSGPRTLIIPLQFWFCRNIGLALPLIALQYHAVEMDFYFYPLSRCYTFGQNNYYTASTNADPLAVPPKPTGPPADNQVYLYKTSNATSDATTYNTYIFNDLNGNKYYIAPDIPITGNGIPGDPYVITLTQNRTTTYNGDSVYISPNGVLSNTVQLAGTRLYGDYIYLDTVERKEFAQNKHRYLIEQVQYRQSETIQGNVTDQKFPIKFNLPVKELIWVLQRDDVFLTNDIFNYSNSVDPSITRGNILTSAYILFNGIERFSPRNGDYFRLTVPYQRHTRVPNDFYYMYCFALKPEEHQPSGISNFSKINFVDLNLTVQPNLPSIQLRVYGLSYNILRIMNGMGSVAFGN